MPRIAVSGHRDLGAETTRLVDAAIRDALSGRTELVGISCLADGADQIFARAVLDLGGSIEAVVPAEEYREGLPELTHAVYDDLIARSSGIYRMPFIESISRAHMAASEFMVNRADELYAVWDGRPARGYGGTADVVDHAHQRGVPVRVIWPTGARRG